MIVLPRQPPGLDLKLPPIYSTPIPSPARPIAVAFSIQCKPAMSSPIERLPHEIQRLVFSNLDYQSLIFLSTMNRHFHRTINPREMADPLDKFQFVMRAAKDFQQHRPSEKGQDHQPGNFECYICFRVRVPEHFDSLQPQSTYVDIRGRVVSDRALCIEDRLVPLRRFCIECGVKFGLHSPSDCLTTKTGQDLWTVGRRRVHFSPSLVQKRETVDKNNTNTKRAGRNASSAPDPVPAGEDMSSPDLTRSWVAIVLRGAGGHLFIWPAVLPLFSSCAVPGLLGHMAPLPAFDSPVPASKSWPAEAERRSYLRRRMSLVEGACKTQLGGGVVRQLPV
ncbi:hypothetical protein G7Z17_g5074 [Cylindrodendrum hubeiense]|uniref:F-box domain-containing protein n=1 Tax=Cylindrodendrum hubeiense TaxID=595255 RepID=A0A9P5H9J5_9HYPO|nr:hypothetical protein G7Z17_g5074 [Cylindrodendrum hubeiense]